MDTSVPQLMEEIVAVVPFVPYDCCLQRTVVVEEIIVVTAAFRQDHNSRAHSTDVLAHLVMEECISATNRSSPKVNAAFLGAQFLDWKWSVGLGSAQQQKVDRLVAVIALQVVVDKGKRGVSLQKKIIEADKGFPKEQFVVMIKMIPQGRVQLYAVDQGAGDSVPQVKEQVGEVLKVILQDKV